MNACPDCGTAWAPGTLACPRCRRLVHRDRLASLAEEARGLEAADPEAAVERWTEAVSLLPHGTKQRATILARIREISPRDASSKTSPAPKWLAALGGIGLLLWKFKFVLGFLITKGKFLLLGLTKWKTAFSMLLFLGVYWTVFGWKFALGIVISIYVHEMGHVAELRRRGLPASAPMFIPGVGAFVRLQSAPKDNIEDARIGLAGPWWGLAAAVVAWLVALATDSALMIAIAQVGAWINLFNMIPVWQLDGGRAFRAMTRKQRLIATGGAAVAWFVTAESMLILVLLGGLYRSFVGPFDEKGDRLGVVAYLVLLAVLGALVMLEVPGITP